MGVAAWGIFFCAPLGTLPASYTDTRYGGSNTYVSAAPQTPIPSTGTI